MLTRHFVNSKPIHTFFCLLAIALCSIVFTFYIDLQEFKFANIAFLSFNLVIVFASVFLIEFVKYKNRITKRSSFTIITFSAILTAFPETLNNTNLLLSNFFVLLSLRRILSLRTKTGVKTKILDSAIWVSLASLFYTWSLLFLCPIFISIAAFVVLDKKTLWIPFLGVTSVIIFLTSYNALFFDTFWINDTYVFSTSLDISSYLNSKQYIKLLILLLVILWLLIYNIKIYQKLRIIYRPMLITIWSFIVVAMLMIAISDQKNSGEIVFLAPVISYALGSYLDFSKHKTFKNIIFMFVLSLPVLGLLFYLL